MNRCTFELPDAEGDAVAVLGELGDLLTSPVKMCAFGSVLN